MNWVLLCFALLIASCQTATKNPASDAQASKNYVSLDLEYPEYKNILNKLDSFLGTQLVNRGEAHITVITPPEFKILSVYVPTPETIHQEWYTWAHKQFAKICLDEGQLKEKDKVLKTYYIVTASEQLLQFRKYLKEKYNAVDFKADTFYPHITIGFTEKDLHFEQGVIKDQKSCPQKLQSILK